MRRAIWIGLVVLALGGGIAAQQIYTPLAKRVNVGAGYIAREVCACMHIARRPFDACRADMPPSMGRIEAEATTQPAGVRAWITLFADRHAIYAPETGCTLQ